MTKQHLLRPFALVALIAIVPALAGCGGETTTATETASLAVHSVPTSTVSIDGVVKGETPLEIELPAGSHEIVLSADGFAPLTEKVDFVKGESQKIEHFLALESVDDERIASVAKELGIETSAFEAPGTHRGADDPVFTQYWPRGKVRLSALTSFRLDVGERYGDDVPNADLVFKKGRKTIHVIEDFDPAMPITIGDMPSEVVSAIKPGSSFTWGLVFEGRKFKKLSDDVKVQVLSKSQAQKIDREVAKLATKKYFKRQDPLVQQTLLAQKLENKRLYTEALLAYIRILEANPGVTSPFRGVVTTLRRLDLDKTEMFSIASQFVGGAGGRSGVNKGGASGTSGALAGNGPGARSLAAITGPKGSTSKGIGAGGSVAVDPSAMKLDDNPASSSGSGGGREGTEGEQRNDGAVGGSGEQHNGERPEDRRDPRVSEPKEESKEDGKENPALDGKNPDVKGPGDGKTEGTAPAQSPVDATREAAEATQGLRDRLQELAGGGQATPAQVQALHQALKDSEDALARMQVAADLAAAGDKDGQAAYDQAKQDYDNAQDAAKQAMPALDPGAVPATPKPTNMEEALKQLAKSGQAPPGSAELYRVLKTTREAQEDAAAKQAAVQAARTAEGNAEATLRKLPPDADTPEHQAAAQALKAAREARQAAELAALEAQEKAATLKDSADQAVDRFADAAQHAREVLKTN